MKKNSLKVKAASCAIALMLSVSPAISSGRNIYLITAEAHQGRTDANGGHRDNKNKSGLGNYHYHCQGHPAHLHKNGVCPYKGGNAGSGTGNQSQGSEKSTASESVQTTTAAIPDTTLPAEPLNAYGWMQDGKGWWYKNSDMTYKKDGVYKIDGKYYLFDSNGYMLTGWQEIGGDWYYCAEDGHMLMDECTAIDGEYCYFENDGSWDGEYYESYMDYLESNDDWDD